jgi:predicted nucleic acid-binding Zn ribbon protein
MKPSRPKPIESVLSDVLAKLGLGKRLAQWRAVEIWSDVVGEQIARAATADRIDQGKLIVRVNSSVWRNELVFLKADIIKKLNDALGDDIVKDIVFR